MKHITAFLFLLFPALFSNATPWNHELWLGGGGLWESRCRITVDNPTSTQYEGKAIAVKVGRNPGEVPLAGVNRASLRVVNNANIQLLYNVWQSDLSAPLQSDTIPEGAVLSLPLVCDAHGSTGFTIYFNNPSAWALADFLSERPDTPLNGDFELGTEKPLGWYENTMQPYHQLARSTESPASGKHCIKQVAAPGLAPSWSGFYRDGISVTPGSEYTLKVKVRTKDLQGDAGWFIHVGNKQNGQMQNSHARISASDSDWQELTMKFKVPDGAETMRTGSLLRGSGTAWFDDLRIECDPPLSTTPPVKISCTPAEQLILRREGADALWIEPPAGSRAWRFRVPVHIIPRPDADQTESCMAILELDSVTRGLPSAHYELTMNGDPVASCRIAENLLFKVQSKPDTLQTFYLYVSDSDPDSTQKKMQKSVLGSDIPSDQIAVTEQNVDMESWQELLKSDLNLVRNADFETGTTLPAEWSSNPGPSEKSEVKLLKAAQGIFGQYCAETTVPSTAKPDWYGWRQELPVTEGATYLFGGWVSTENLAASGQLHAHINPAKGSGAKTVFLSAGRPISGTTGWTPMFSSITVPYDHDRFSLHLTSNTTGTMRYDGMFLALCLPAVTGEPQTKPQREDLIVWQANPVIKIFKEALPDAAAGELKIHMARNESEPLQLALRSGKDFDQLQIKVSPPVLNSGGAIRNFFRSCFNFSGQSDTPASQVLSNITIGRVGYVPIDAKSCYSNLRTPDWEFKFPSQKNGSDGWAGWWPDPIIETPDFSLKANTTQPLWITFDTDAGTAPGVYQGTIEIVDNGRTLLKQSYSVHVWDFEIPLRPEFPAIYDIRFKEIGFSNWENSIVAYDQVLRFMAKKKLSPDTVQSHIPLKLDENGRVICDFTEYDKACKLYFDELEFKVSYMPHNFNIFGWAHPPRKFMGQQPYEGEYPFEKVDRSKLRPEYKRLFQEALKLYWDHLKAMGLEKSFVLYISDEPHFNEEHIAIQMKALCDMIHDVDPTIRIYSSTWRYCKEWDDAIDVWGVGHYGCYPVEEMKRQRTLNNEIWFTTDGQMCTDTPLLATERMLPHYAFKYNADAYEFWGVSWYTYNPWDFGWHSYIRQSSTPGDFYSVRYPDGDGYLIYPPTPEMGDSKEPVTSIRIEAARDGVEDFCYLKQLQSLADKHQDQDAKNLLEEFLSFSEIPNAGGRYSSANLSDPDRMMQLRVQIGNTIERLTGKTL